MNYEPLYILGCVITAILIWREEKNGLMPKRYIRSKQKYLFFHDPQVMKDEELFVLTIAKDAPSYEYL